MYYLHRSHSIILIFSSIFSQDSLEEMATETAGVGIITGQKPVSSGTVQMTAALLYSILTTISVCISPVICDLFNEKRQPSHSGSSYEQHKSPPMLSFVHTFETSDQCGMICPRPCVMRIMEDLEMMQRWICDPSARVNF
jgi:hypothetical protein